MKNWQRQLKASITSPEKLLYELGLTNNQFKCANKVNAAQNQFKVRVPRAFVAKMQAGNPCDPLLLQVLAQGQEMQSIAGYTKDPLAELSSNPLPGLIHKYKTRVLLTLAAGCAINCRYCFRRHFPYNQQMMSKTQQRDVINYLRNHPEVNEVILSGGDPLMLQDDHLKMWLKQLEEVKTLSRIRIHTRFPVVIPQRITVELTEILNSSRFKIIMVLHINHPNEVDEELSKHLELLAKSGVLLLNQTVLLKGVNDDVDTLTRLSETLFTAHVLPYYLHRLDKVQGAAHFDIPLQQVLALYQLLQAELPGFLLPKLVEERAGKKYKVIIGDSTDAVMP